MTGVQTCALPIFVNGGEKVIISQERVAENQVFVWPPTKSTTAKYTHEAEIKTSIDQRFFPIKVNKVKLTKEPSQRMIKQSRTIKVGDSIGITYGRTIKVQFPYMKEDIPLFIMFRALGIATEKEALEMILPDMDMIGSNFTNFLIPSIDEARSSTVSFGTGEEKSEIVGITTQEMALKYLIERLNITYDSTFKQEPFQCQMKYVNEIINRELFPHIGLMLPTLGQTFRKKAFFLGYMTRKLLDCYFGVRPYDDRDHYGNKRVDLTGPLITKLFRANFIKLIKDMRQQILHKLCDKVAKTDSQMLVQLLRKIIQGCNIDSKIKYGLSTGNWGTQKGSMSSTEKGIAQVLNRLSFAGALSHTRRIQSPLERAGSKIVQPRKLHGTHYGMCCLNETPEGQQIGVVKNLAMQTHITIQTNDYPIRIILKKLGVIDTIEIIAKETQSMTKVFVNGDWYGVIHEDKTNQLYTRLQTLKRHGVIVPYISIAWFIDWKEIKIQTDGGRYSRPLYITNDNELLIEQLFNKNKIFQQKLIEGHIKWQELLFGFHEGDAGYDVKKANHINGGVVEYLDTNEIESSMIAMTKQDLDQNDPKGSVYMKYTHIEIHPMMMMGVISAMIPYSDMSQSPRNCYQCLWKEEEVIMADGTKKKISDIIVGDMVITVDPMTLEQKPTRVINQYVKTTTKKIVTVIISSKKEVVCTEDHPILTPNGWKNAGLLTNKDSVCVCRYTRNRMSVFVPVERVISHENVEIADITTESENHSFITGHGICVHNSSMAKQSMGFYVTNYNQRMDTLAHVMVYGQKPLVTTRMGKYTLMDNLPHGGEAQLLYGCYTGYNQEDSIILNRDAIERGYFNTIFFRTYIDKAQKHRSATTATEQFTKPDTQSSIKIDDIKSDKAYHAISETGEPILGKAIKGGDVIIGKIIEVKERDQQEYTYRDISTVARANEEGIVDLVIPSKDSDLLPFNAEGHRIVKARVSVVREPEIGDKFASRYSQKGTVSIMYRSIDLPFTCYGLYPDIIMNPHGIPSRMTVGKLLETLMGRIAVCTGEIQDATPFVDRDLNSFRRILKSYGCNEFGNEVMYNGQTGQMYDVQFFYGPTYYQRLKHMVLDKVHSRESGPVQLLTRQPAEGRSRDGGLRLGEMERDVFISHWIQTFLKERMMDSSDLFKAYVSKKDEAMIVGNPVRHIFKFNGKNVSEDEVVQIQLPYAMKLLLQELESMGLDIRLKMS